MMTNTRMIYRCLTLLLLLCCITTFGCKLFRPDSQKTLVGHVPLKDERREISPQERRAFEDAVAVIEEQESQAELDLDSLRIRFERLVEQIPRVGEAWYNLGVIYEKKGEIALAEQAYIKALERKPTLRPAVENLVVIFQNQGKSREAVELLHQILRIYPEDANARARLADVYRAQGDMQNASSFVRETFIRDAQNVLGHKVLMHVAIASGEIPKARLLARKVLSLGDEDPEVYWELAKLDMNSGDREAALANVMQAASLKPDYLPPRIVLAKMARDREDWLTALKYYDEILEHYSDRADVWLNKGIALRGLGRLDEAEAAYAKVLQIDPNESLAVLNRGILRFHGHGDPAGGIADFESFVEMSRALPRNHIVFNLMREAEETIRLEEEKRRQEEEARRLEEERLRQEEEEMRKMEEEMKRMEEEMERYEEELNRQEEDQEGEEGSLEGQDEETGPQA